MNCSACGQDNHSEARFCSQCGNALTAVAEPVHVIAIGVVSSYGNGWRQLWKNFLMLLLMTIITAVLTSPTSIANRIGQEIDGDAVGAGMAAAMLFSAVFTILFANPLAYGLSFAFLIAARDEQLDLKDMFEGFRYYVNAVLASLLVGVIIGFGIVFLIVPGIIFACKLAFTPYLVVDRRMGVIDAVGESWRMTKGHAWKVFGIALLAIPIAIAGLVCCFVGIFPAVMWCKLAFASLYHAVDVSGMPVAHEPAPVV